MSRVIKQKLKKQTIPTIFSRFLFIVAIFVIWMGIIGVRLVHLQVNQHTELYNKALSQRRDVLKNKLLRGSILDRSGRALAISLKTQSLFADPSEITDIDTTAFRLANVLHGKPSDLISQLRESKDSNKRFLWLARKLDSDAVQKINDLGLPGIHWREEQKRSYPQGNLAAQVVGFSNSEDVGQAGIELSQDKNLHGETIESWQEKDRLGRIYDQQTAEESKAPPKDILLTIDSGIQYRVEESLKNGVEAANAKAGIAIAMDPKTGEILAMANYPTFDPNKFGEAIPENIKNNAIQNTYTPGSTFKLVSYSAALDDNDIQPDDRIDTNKGSIKVGDREISDSHTSTNPTATDALAISSNVAAIKVAQKLGKDKLYEYALRFGFAAQTNVELPAEAAGQLKQPKFWNPDSLGSMAIGYEMGANFLQTTAAYCAIANGGVRIAPHLIKEIHEASGVVLPQPEFEKRNVVTAETAQKMRQMLRRVVTAGTGVSAQPNGYTVAGKTGTARKWDVKGKKFSETKLLSSFVGMAPAENPAVVIGVWLDEPRVKFADGGRVAAPIFRDIAEKILPEMNILPDTGARETAEPIVSDTKTSSSATLVEKSEKIERSAKSDDREKTPTAVKSVDSNDNKKTEKHEKKDSEKNDSSALAEIKSDKLESKSSKETLKSGKEILREKPETLRKVKEDSSNEKKSDAKPKATLADKKGNKT